MLNLLTLTTAPRKLDKKKLNLLEIRQKMLNLQTLTLNQIRQKNA